MKKLPIQFSGRSHFGRSCKNFLRPLFQPNYFQKLYFHGSILMKLCRGVLLIIQKNYMHRNFITFRFYHLFYHLFFSYSINWEISETMWASRWNMYLNAKSDVQIHWFSIVNSLIVVLFLFGIIAMIIIRTVKRDISQVKKNS